MPLVVAQAETFFANGAALAMAGTAAMAIPIVVHLLFRLRLRRHPWGAMRFVSQAIQRHRQRLRLEQWVLMLLRCLIVLLIGLALAGLLISDVARLLGRLDNAERTVYLVIDDSLSTRAQTADGKQRFDALRAQALELVSQLDPSDAISVWRAARPFEAVIERPTLDRAALWSAISNLSPRYSRPMLSEVLSLISQSATRARGPAKAPGRTLIVILSDFAQSTGDVGRPLPEELRGLGKRARLVVSRPMPGAPNRQIKSVTARRRMVVAGRIGAPGPWGPSGFEDTALIPLTVSLRRFEVTSTDRSLVVSLELLDQKGSVLAEKTKAGHFAPGQGIASVHMDLVVPLNVLELTEDSRSRGQWLVLRARLQHSAGADVLEDDNHRFAVIELRCTLRVGLVDESGPNTPSRLLNGPMPGQWLSLALDPSTGALSRPIEQVLLRPTEVTAAQVEALDALIVLRPDLLPDRGWRPLVDFAQGGGLVWIFTPPLGDSPAIWTRSLRRAFALPWQIGIDPAVVGVPEQSVGLDTEGVVPEALELLAADWADLLRPVAIRRLLMLEVDDTDAWIRLASDQRKWAIMAGRDVGDGTLLLLTTALDHAWTNLPTKPVFVPLVHETLRGVLGRPRGIDAVELVVGDQPVLGGEWAVVSALKRLALSEAEDTSARIRVPLIGTGQDRRPADPFVYPGVYEAAFAKTPSRIAVNVDADAGHIGVVDAGELAQWLSSAGPWEFLDQENPAGALRRQVERVNIGWGLLWLVLGLVLLETLAARILSHARVTMTSHPVKVQAGSYKASREVSPRHPPLQGGVV